MSKKFKPGDIVGVCGTGFLPWCAYHIFKPQTRLYHWLIIGDYILQEDDYEILEAIATGVRVGRLSWYAKDRYSVFRLTDPRVAGAAELGWDAFHNASRFGRWGYDYLLYPLIAFDMVKILLRMIFREHRFRKVEPGEIPYRSNHAFVCSECANAIWKEFGLNPVPDRIMALPAAMVQAFYEGRMRVVGVNAAPRRK